MKIVVIGDGKVGRAIVEHTCQEGHEVVVIDTNPSVVEELVNQYDVMGICGNGASYEIQSNASVDKADLVVAATSSDETNVLSCMIAKNLGAKSTVARIRSYEYNKQINQMKRDFGITMTINPEKEASLEIMKILNFPEAIRVDTFAKGNVDLVELYIPENSPLIGQSLASIHQKYQVKVLVCAVQRNEDVFIPTGNFTFQAKDKIHITARRLMVKQFLNKLGLIESKIKNVLIIGGGKIAVYLGEYLLKSKYQVKIIEKDYDRCLELSQLLPNATIIHGNASDQRVLDEEGLTNNDAIVCLTGIDEENIIISMYAYKQNVHKIVAKINKTSLIGLIDSINMVSTIAPKEITASRIVSYIRATNNSRGSNIITLYKLVNNKVEALEFKASEKSKVLSIPFKNLKVKKNVLIAGIIREGDVIIPSGDDMIQAGDNVIVITTNQRLDDLDDIRE